MIDLIVQISASIVVIALAIIFILISYQAIWNEFW
jgi:hypothetical protein